MMLLTTGLICVLGGIRLSWNRVNRALDVLELEAVTRFRTCLNIKK
jgi:hypothetical protein